MLDEEIRKMIKEEIKKQVQPVIDEMLILSSRNNDLFNELEQNVKETHEILGKMREDLQTTPVVRRPTSPSQLDEAKKQLAKEINESIEEEQEVPLEWVKEQDGDLNKGGTQIWRYGNHTLTVWTEGKKYLAQIDDEEPEDLWKQSDLEKIQKRIEKIRQE